MKACITEFSISHTTYYLLPTTVARSLLERVGN